MGKRLEQQNTVETLNGDRDALLRFSVSFQVFTGGGGAVISGIKYLGEGIISWTLDVHMVYPY